MFVAALCASLCLLLACGFLWKKAAIQRLLADLQCLWTMCFGRISGESHKERLESFYRPQANAYDDYRANLLHGRKQMLAACAARLRGKSGLVWVDLGGGTAANLEMMSQFMNLNAFQQIYVVDLCQSLCNEARKKVAKHGWTNVQVVEGSACDFVCPKSAALITFSYSLTMIPDFMCAVDKALSYMNDDGIMGVADFYTSSKYDQQNRQSSWLNRWLWRIVFEQDDISVGPERRQYLDHKLETVSEYNGRGTFPYFPKFLKAPYYVWLGRKPGCSKVDDPLHYPVSASDNLEVQIPRSFPTTFLYSLSWEDPREDEPILDIKPSDVVLTLTSGSCNALDLVLQGAKQVVAVDMNPAQSYLAELKRLALVRLSYGDLWKLFGEGVHPQFEELLEKELAPFLSQGAVNFWRKKAKYFRKGLYYQGGMGRLIRAVRALAKVTGREKFIEALVNAPTLQKQKEIWFEGAGNWLQSSLAKSLSILITNPLTMWFCAGVCKGQLNHLRKEDEVYNYIVRCLNSTAAYSHLRDSNYFYTVCLKGKFSRNCCPRFLEKEHFTKLKTRLASEECLLICTNTFVAELNKRMYNKVILMDHVDWLKQKDIDVLCEALQKHVVPGGRVIWRSASRNPSYAKDIEKAGFFVVQVATSEAYMDRVNMYASFFVGIRLGGNSLPIVKIPIRTSSKLHDKQPNSPNWVEFDPVTFDNRY